MRVCQFYLKFINTLYKERKIDTYLKNSTAQAINSSSSPRSTLSSQNSKVQYSNETIKASKPSYDKEKKVFNSFLRCNDVYRTDGLNSLKSLNELKDSVERNASKTIYDILQSMNFVGFVTRELALIQHRTALYLSNTQRLSEELFYQLALFNFGNFGFYKLAEPVLLSELATMALDNPESEWTPEDGSKERLSSRCALFLKSKANILVDYFSIKIVCDIEKKHGKDILNNLCLIFVS